MPVTALAKVLTKIVISF